MSWYNQQPVIGPVGAHLHQSIEYRRVAGVTDIHVEVPVHILLLIVRYRPIQLAPNAQSSGLVLDPSSTVPQDHDDRCCEGSDGGNSRKPLRYSAQPFHGSPPLSSDVASR